MYLDESILAAIDARVRAGEKDILAFGTVADVTTDNDMTVTFDGSVASVSCKNFGNVFALPGDRVGVAKIGVWWVVFGTMNRRWPSESGRSVAQTAGTTTSSTLADLPQNASFTWTKYWGATRVHIAMTGSAFVTLASTTLTWGVSFTGGTGTVTTLDVCNLWFNPASTHEAVADQAVTALAADTYTVTAQWRRNGGTGTGTVDTADRVSLWVREVSP